MTDPEQDLKQVEANLDQDGIIERLVFALLAAGIAAILIIGVLS